MSKIQQIIEELETYVRECKSPTFGGSGKIICEKSAIEDFLEDLRESTPEEIKKYQKIISQKDMILADAKSQSNAFIADAKKQAQKMVDEHEIVISAQNEAKEILAAANEDAARIREEAQEEVEEYRRGIISYADETLSGLQAIVQDAIAEQEDRSASLISNLKAVEEKILADRQETSEQEQEAAAAAREDLPAEGFERIDEAEDEGEDFLRDPYENGE